MDEFVSYYEITEDIKDILKQIEEKVSQINVINKGEKFYNLCAEIQKENIYSTLAIKNNNITLQSVEKVINNKSAHESNKDNIAIKNVKYAYDNANDINIYKIIDLLKMHNTITRNIIQDSGCTRSQQVVSYSQGKVIYFAVQPRQVVSRLENLFKWLLSSSENPLVKACVFYYEFKFIHPFRVANGIVNRIWQKEILSNYNSIFMTLPIETQIKQNYEKLNNILAFSMADGDCTNFILFMLILINNSFEEFLNKLNK